MQVYQLVVMTSLLLLFGVDHTDTNEQNVGNTAFRLAYADGFSFAKPDILFTITNFIEDIRIEIADSVETKNKLINEFINDKQSRIDKAFVNNEKISMDVEKRRTELIKKTSSIDSGVSKLRSEIDTLSELNDIKILYSQFPDCIKTCDQNEKSIFNNKVNSLKSWKTRCTGIFDIDDYKFNDVSFDKLSSKCPDLKKYTKSALLQGISK